MHISSDQTDCALIRRSNLGQKTVPKRHQTVVTVSGEPLAGPCPEPAGQTGQFCGEVVQGETRIVQWPVFGARIRRIIEARAHAPGHVKASRYAHQSDGVQPVGILKDHRLNGLGRDIGGEAVRLDRMSHPLNVFAGPAQRAEHAARPIRRQARRL